MWFEIPNQNYTLRGVPVYTSDGVNGELHVLAVKPFFFF